MPDDDPFRDRVTPQIKPPCEPFRFDGGKVGVLLQHGFSGCPASMRPMGEWLAERGLTVLGPRWPGHGTRWEDMEGTTWQDWEAESESAVRDLRSRCSTVVGVGLSVGGSMVLHLAAEHPDLMQGVVAINAYVRKPQLVFAPLVRLFTRTIKGVGNDVKRPGVDEIAYDRLPVKAVNEMGKFLRRVARELPSVRAPLLVLSANEDHVADPSNSRHIMRRVASEQKRLIPLTNCYHVATLDYDAELVFQQVLEFAHSLAAVTPPA